MLTVEKTEEVLPLLASIQVDGIVSDSIAVHLAPTIKEKYPHIKFVVYSGKSDENRPGVDEWIVKPVPPKELKELLLRRFTNESK